MELATRSYLVAASSLLLGCIHIVDAQTPPQFAIELVRGSGEPMCEAYAEWSRTGRRLGDAAAQRFQVDLGERFIGSEDEWLLLTNVEQFLWERDANPARYVPVNEAPRWQRTPEQLEVARQRFHRVFEMDLSRWGYQLGQVDVDNDGMSDPVFFTRRQSGSTLLMLDALRTAVDLEKTERILRHMARAAAAWPDVRPPWPEEPSLYSLVPVGDALGGAEYNVLSYDGRIYVSFLWSRHPDFSVGAWRDRRTEHIFRTLGDVSEELCELRNGGPVVSP
jgi:hypothetical protein